VNADEIRAEAIERIARAFYESWREIFNAMPKYPGDGPEALPYDEAPDDYKMKRGYRRQAAEVVAALGDLLPDAYVESRGGCDVEKFGGEIVRRIPLEERYMTEWREVA
jgi:hypothetical protein